MSLFLSKLLPQFVYPVGLVITLAIIAWLFALFGFKRISRYSMIVAVGILWISSTPVFSSMLYRQLEKEYKPVPIEYSSSADVVIVLGGIMGQQLQPHIAPDLSGSVDRVLHAARLYHADKVKKIVVAAGNLPWLKSIKPEALLIADLLMEWGVPEEAISLETESRNTYENAKGAKRIMDEQGYKRALLVTSAMHMPRALATFRTVGINAIPSPTDYHSVNRKKITVMEFLPDAGALKGTTNVIKEYLGTLVYRWRGWIE